MIDPITEYILEGMFSSSSSVVKDVQNKIKMATAEARKKEAGSCDNHTDTNKRRKCLLQGMVRLLNKRDSIIKAGVRKCGNDSGCMNTLKKMGMDNARQIRMNKEEINKL